MIRNHHIGPFPLIHSQGAAKYCYFGELHHRISTRKQLRLAWTHMSHVQNQVMYILVYWLVNGERSLCHVLWNFLYISGLVGGWATHLIKISLVKISQIASFRQGENEQLLKPPPSFSFLSSCINYTRFNKPLLSRCDKNLPESHREILYFFGGCHCQGDSSLIFRICYEKSKILWD